MNDVSLDLEKALRELERQGQLTSVNNTACREADRISKLYMQEVEERKYLVENTDKVYYS